MKVGDVICVVDFYDSCPRQVRKVGVMEFGLMPSLNLCVIADIGIRCNSLKQSNNRPVF